MAAKGGKGCISKVSSNTFVSINTDIINLKFLDFGNGLATSQIWCLYTSHKCQENRQKCRSFSAATELTAICLGFDSFLQFTHYTGLCRKCLGDWWRLMGFWYSRNFQGANNVVGLRQKKRCAYLQTNIRLRFHKSSQRHFYVVN